MAITITYDFDNDGKVADLEIDGCSNELGTRLATMIIEHEELNGRSIEHDMLIAALRACYELAEGSLLKSKEMAETVVWRVRSKPMGGVDLRYLDKEINE